MRYLYTLGGDDDDLELARAELWALTGCEAEGRVGRSPVACDISRATYVGMCVEAIARADTLDDLCAQVEAMGLESDGFRIEVHKQGPRPAEGSPEIARRVADAMPGLPDLDAPRERFALFCREGAWELGRVLSGSRRGYRLQAGRPHNFSLALTARHARALVNLVAAPGDTLVDPCCGVGTCLVEACLMGVRATGCDISRPAVFAAAANLRHFGLRAAVAVADARRIGGTFDAAVLDFPYGHTSTVPEGLHGEILNHVAPRVFRIGAVLGEASEDMFADLSLEVLRRAQVRCNRLVRHFYVLRGRRPGACPADAQTEGG